MSEWISVKDRLPDETCPCVVYVPDWTGSGGGQMVLAAFYAKEGKFSVVSWPGNQVTHWMPLLPPSDEPSPLFCMKCAHEHTAGLDRDCLVINCECEGSVD